MSICLVSEQGGTNCFLLTAGFWSLIFNILHTGLQVRTQEKRLINHSTSWCVTVMIIIWYKIITSCFSSFSPSLLVSSGSAPRSFPLLLSYINFLSQSITPLHFGYCIFVQHFLVGQPNFVLSFFFFLLKSFILARKYKKTKSLYV